mgnify:CR=1 FL=1
MDPCRAQSQSIPQTRDASAGLQAAGDHAREAATALTDQVATLARTGREAGDAAEARGEEPEGASAAAVGGALAAVLLARIASRRGRRAALVTGYALGVIGAVGTVAAAVTGSFTLLLAAALLFGGATASNNAARYAATDPMPASRDVDVRAEVIRARLA